MHKHRLQVLAVLTLAAAPVVAQWRAGAPSPSGVPSAPSRAPLLPLSVGDWVAASGGLAPLSLRMHNVTLDQIAREVERQTGLDVAVPEIQMQPSGTEGGGGGALEEPVFSVEAGGKPFWQALREWNRGPQPVKLGPDWESRPRWRIEPGAPEANEGILIQAGPFEMAARHASMFRSRTLGTTGTPTPQRALTIQGTMRTDPRIVPSIHAMLLEISEAVDDRGRAIAVRERSQNLHTLGAGDIGTLIFSLDMPQPDARTVARLKGTLRLAVAVKSEKWEVALKDAPKASKTFASNGGTTTIHFDGITPGAASATGAATATASLRVVRRDGPGTRTFRAPARGPMQGPDQDGEVLELVQVLMRGLRIVNAKGERVDSGGGAWHASGVPDAQGQAAYAITIPLSSPRAPAPIAPVPGATPMSGPIVSAPIVSDPTASVPARLVAQVPLEWREVQIPFEFKDLPLP